MAEPLEIATLIERRSNELALSRPALVGRLGYLNTTKGIRRLAALCEGKLDAVPRLAELLPYALELDPAVVREAVIETRVQIAAARKRAAAEAERHWRENFQPHAVVLTERNVPSHITMCAIVGGERFKWIDLDTSQRRATFIKQALEKQERRMVAANTATVPFFGAPTGIVVNFEPDRAVRYDMDGRAVEILPKAVRLGKSVATVRGQRPSSLAQ
jgi:hypothetical protein